MGKQKGKNGFWHYMIHKQNELKRNGQNYQINDSRLQAIAGDEWKAMTKEEKEPFDAMAIRNRERANNRIEITPQSYSQRNNNNFGRMLSQESIPLDEDSGREAYYQRLIEGCVKACKSKDDLLNASFFIMGSNVMVRTDEKPPKYLPLEIGICQYSIQNGIHYTYHEFIDAGGVPMGYMHHSKEHAQMTHKIPLDDFALASNNYEKMVEDITAVLSNSRFTNEINGQPTPMLVFCREDAIDQNRGIFDWLSAKYSESVPGFKWDIEVLDLSSLVFQILSSVGKRTALALIENMLNRSAFDYSPNTLCEFHQEIENRYCAKGLARRLCYMLSGILCEDFDISPTENHLPSKLEGVVVETYMGTLQDFHPTPRNRYCSTLHKRDDDWEPKDDQPMEVDRSQSRVSTGIGRGKNNWSTNN